MGKFEAVLEGILNDIKYNFKKKWGGDHSDHQYENYEEFVFYVSEEIVATMTEFNVDMNMAMRNLKMDGHKNFYRLLNDYTQRFQKTHQEIMGDIKKAVETRVTDTPKPDINNNTKLNKLNTDNPTHSPSQDSYKSY